MAKELGLLHLPAMKKFRPPFITCSAVPLRATASPSYSDPACLACGGSGLRYRIAVGRQQGRKVFTLQTLPDCESDNSSPATVGKTAGFSLHAGVATQANEREKLERLCRYITRPALSANRMSLTRNGEVRYELKTPWRNGTTHIIFEPLDFMHRMYGMPRAQGCAGAANGRARGQCRRPL